MAVLYTQHFTQFFDDDGNPLSGGFLYTYAAGTSTPKATYTTPEGDVQHPNPIELDAAGKPTTGAIFLNGSYKFALHDADDAPVDGGTTDNITSFTVVPSGSDSFFQKFSGNGTNTAFTLSDDLGTDEKAILVFIDSGLNNHATNGTFDSDTGWVKGSGWTIGSGVATATGAISTAIEQDAGVTLVQGQSYNVTYTVTRSAGSITASIGGTAGTARSSSATFTETIIAGSTQKLTFTGAGFTGTIDVVNVTKAVGNGLQIIDPTTYTLDGTSLEFSTAPASGTGNIWVIAPSLLVAAASAAAAAAEGFSNIAEGAAEIAQSAAGYTYTYSSTTTDADPGAGFLRFNHATLASATALYISETTDAAQAIASDLATWDDGSSVIRGRIRVFKRADPAVFAIFNVTGALTDNGAWDTLTVAYVGGSGSLVNNDDVTIQFTSNGDKGDIGPDGTVFPVAQGAGTVDAITANFTPDITLADKTTVCFIATGANTSTTPSFTPDGLPTHTIVKDGGQALVAGDIPAVGARMLLQYDLANTRWELLNPGGTSAGRAILYAASASAQRTAMAAAGTGDANTFTRGQVIDGTADEIQLRIQGNGTQTSSLIVAEASDGTDIFTVGGSSSAATMGLLGSSSVQFSMTSGAAGAYINAGATFADMGSFTAHSVRIIVNNSARATFFSGGGMNIGAPTGGDKGAGTLNAVGVYDDNVLLTCYVIEAFKTGDVDMLSWNEMALDRVHPVEEMIEQEFDENYRCPKTKKIKTRKIKRKVLTVVGETIEPREHFGARKFKERLGGQYDPLDMDKYWQHALDKGHLTSMPNREKFDPAKGISTGEIIQRLWETVEIQAVHIQKLNERLKKLEEKA